MRVAAYCRVSTDREDQANSFESQRRYFREYIEKNPDWELYEIYADEGISGTGTKKRRQFNRMISDAESGCFGLIVTKEVSRFARNTLDALQYTRELKRRGVGVLFLNDGINTLDPDAELRLTIMSSIAQEESRKTSERVKWGQRRRMEQGVVFGRDLLGYRVYGGKLYLREDEAETVRLIFRKFVLEGKGAYAIARELEEAGIRPAAHMKRWSHTAVLRILRNEKYCGDLIQKKTYTPDYLNHEKKRNRGEEELVVLRGHHPPIVGRELFDRAQAELQRRSNGAAAGTKHSARCCFSGKIRCACGSSYVSRTKKRKDGSVYRAWRCYEAVNRGSRKTGAPGKQVGCDSPTLNEEDLKELLRRTFREFPFDRSAAADSVCCAVEAVLEESGPDADAAREKRKRENLERRKQALIELYASGEIGASDFRRAKDRCEGEALRLAREEEEHCARSARAKQRESLPGQIRGRVSALLSGEVWDETFYRDILERIAVGENHRLDVSFAGLPGARGLLLFDCARIGAEWKKVPQAFREFLRRHIGTPAGTEELGHLEMVGTIVYQLTRNLTPEQIKEAGFDAYFVDHTTGIYPNDASGTPFTAAALAVSGDPIADLHEDLAAEQKARLTYDNILRFCDDPDVKDPIRFLRQREVVHYQRFGEGLRITTDHLDSKNFYAFNPSFDKKSNS